MSRSVLIAWHHQRQVGTLFREETLRWGFQYAPGWVAAPEFSLSPTLGLSADAWLDTSSHRPVEFFFENLLPEEGIRRQITRRIGVPETDSWGLLEALGRETAGALSLLPEGRAPDSVEESVPLSHEDFVERILAARRGAPLLDSGPDRRMSLAGA